MKRIDNDNKLSFAEALLQQKKFHFQKRNGRLDLQSLKAINVSKVVNEMDVDTLQRYLENLTYSEVCVDDFRLYSEDCLVRLFQIAQLTLEYLLNVQDTLAINLNSLAAKYANQKREMKVMQSLISEQKNTIDGIAEVKTHSNALGPNVKDLQRKPIILTDDRVQHANFGEDANQSDMQCFLKAMQNEIVGENKRNFENETDKTLKFFMLSFASQQRDNVQIIGEQMSHENKINIENEADRIMKSLMQSLACQQKEIVLQALEEYFRTVDQNRVCISCKLVDKTSSSKSCVKNAEESKPCCGDEFCCEEPCSIQTAPYGVRNRSLEGNDKAQKIEPPGEINTDKTLGVGKQGVLEESFPVEISTYCSFEIAKQGGGDTVSHASKVNKGRMRRFFKAFLPKRGFLNGRGL